MTAELVVSGEHRLVESVFTAGPGRRYIGYGMWELDVYARGTSPRLMLRMDNAGQVSPLSADISAAALSRWRFPGRLPP